MKRLISVLLAIILVFSCALPVSACDQNQTETYVTQLIFGDSAASYEENSKGKILLSALYLCSEQSGESGKEQINVLKKNKVSSVPKLSDIKLSEKQVLDNLHSTWEKAGTNGGEQAKKRTKLLKNTVNKVFDFGFLNNHFGSDKGRCNSFAAYLYYSHILCDYLADDPENTEVALEKGYISSFSGATYVEINGNRPQFTKAEKENTEKFTKLSALDTLGRAGKAFANITKESLPEANSRQNIGNIKPSGWNQEKYEGIINTRPPYVYNRCHLIGHQLIGVDTKENLITGTRYLNEAMIPWENLVTDYIKETGNHVLYRATPVYKGENLLASGVQLEAYSVEDSGEGVSFNIYLYNVQPGINLNYANGKTQKSESMSDSDEILPFAVTNPSDYNPDLMYEMNKHLEILFEDQNGSRTYSSMMSKLKEVSSTARNVGNTGDNQGRQYIQLNECKYQYFETLKEYVPQLLEKESFFKSAF